MRAEDDLGTPRARAILLLLAAKFVVAASEARGGMSAEPVSTLDGSRWALTRAELPVEEPAYGRRTTIQFAAGHIRVRGGCTSGTARYQIVANALIINHMRLAQSACTDGQQRFDNTLSTALAARPMLQQSPTGLILDAVGGKLRFSEEPGPSSTAATDVIEVAATRIPCMGNVPAMCLQTRTEATEPWGIFYEGIMDFRPEPGVEYRLRIRVDPWPNPPADAPSRKIFLDTILSQRTVDSR
jgi:heat shock protein HslJ